MTIYPAIDIKDGRCVRLRQGRFEDMVVYSDKPYEVAQRWERLKASYIHVVDLDGALDGRFANKEALKEIVGSVSIPIQTGGGIRSSSDIEDRLGIGITRVIIGTKALWSPEFMEEMIRRFGDDRIAVGIDAKDGRVAVEGWGKVSETSAIGLALIMRECGVRTVVYTDVSKDGMMGGPNLTHTKEMIDKTGLDIIASGGVSQMKDLCDLDGIGAKGAVIGKALYEERIDLSDVVAMFENKWNSVSRI